MNAKFIFIVKDMQCEHCEMAIKKALSDAGIECDIDLKNKTVAIAGGGDNVHAARRAITQAGYTIL